PRPRRRRRRPRLPPPLASPLRRRPPAAGEGRAVSPLYLYALVGEAPSAPGGLGNGLAGEPIRVVPAAGLPVAGGEGEPPPAPSALALAAHDAVVRRLAAAAPAVPPSRFGQEVADPAALAAALAPRAAELGVALARVAGCVQMTLRIFSPPGEPAA